MEMDVKTPLPAAGTPAIKAIQTTYKGYRFRSRLEARWAVFFDGMGLEWEYEPEGFEFPDGSRYLPDFRIKKVFDMPEGVMHERHIWVEVKAQFPTDFEREKMQKICVASNQDGWDFADGYIVWGDPLQGNTMTFCGVLDCNGKFARRDLGLTNLEETIFALMCDFCPAWSDTPSYDQVLAAAQAARSARFEFGECGAAS